MPNNQAGSSKKAEEVSFERAPFWKELGHLGEKFNNLRAEHRHLLRRLIETGNLFQALKDSRLLDSVEKRLDFNLPATTAAQTALSSYGLNWNSVIAEYKKVAFEYEKKLDGKGNIVEVQNNNAKIKALDRIVLMLDRVDGNKEATLNEVEDLFKSTKI